MSLDFSDLPTPAPPPGQAPTATVPGATPTAATNVVPPSRPPAPGRRPAGPKPLDFSDLPTPSPTTPARPQQPGLLARAGDVVRRAETAVQPAINVAERVGQALAPAANVAVEATNLPGQAIQTGKSALLGAAGKALSFGVSMAGKPSEMTEHTITGGQGYDTWLAGVERSAAAKGIPIQPMTDGQRAFAAGALRVVLDPTNLLMFPERAIYQPLTIAAKYGRDAVAFGRAQGWDTALSQAYARLEQGRITGQAAQMTRTVLQQVSQGARVAGDELLKIFDRAHGLGDAAPILRRLEGELHGDVYTVARESQDMAQRLFDAVPDEAERTMMYHVFDGVLVPEALGPVGSRLRNAWEEAAKIIDAHTKDAVEGGYIDHAIDNYIRHLYPKADLEQVRRFARPIADEAAAANMQTRSGPGRLGTTMGRSKPRSFVDSAAAADKGFHPITDTAVAIPFSHAELGLAKAKTRYLRNLVNTLGELWVQDWRDAPKGWVRLGDIIGNPTAERTIVEGRKVVATPPVPVTDALAPTATRVESLPLVPGRPFATYESPAMQLGQQLGRRPYPAWIKPIQDMGRREVESAARILRGQKRGELADQLQADWMALNRRRQITSNVRAAPKTLADKAVEPRLAEYLQDLMARSGREHQWILRQAGAILSGYKRWTFYFPMVHGWNVARSAFLADGFRVFNYGRWKEMVKDADEFGEWSRRYVSTGRTFGTSPWREHYSMVDGIVNQSFVTKTLARDRLSWANLRQSPGQVIGVLHDLMSDFLWNKLDRGMRLSVFRSMVEHRGYDIDEAARLTESHMNNYSRASMSDMEKRFAGLWFTYAWNKGRMQLFGNMARSLVPGTALSAAERAAFQQSTMRWAITNLVFPHIVRAIESHASGGFLAGAYPIGTYQTQSGTQRPLYFDPTGFYSDAAQFFADPVNFAETRATPPLRLAFDALRARDQAVATGQNPTAAALGSVTRYVSPPAGIPQVFGTGQPWYGRALSLLGMPTRTTAGAADDPRIAMQEDLQNGDYMGAARILHEANLGFNFITSQIRDPVQRAALERAYNHLYPRARSTGLPGFPAPSSGGSLPGMPRVR